MAKFKKMLKILGVLFLSLVLLFLGVTGQTRPSKSKLCKVLESYLPIAECLQMGNALEIVKRAFPEGEVYTTDVKGALGEYLHAEYPTSYGHLEEYYLSVRPIDYLFRNFDSYRFAYDSNGLLVAFSYDD